MVNKVFCIAMALITFSGCGDAASDCAEGESRIKEWHGHIRIDSLFQDWRNHADAAVDKNGNKILYVSLDFVIAPEKGDSLFKDTGTVEYTLVRRDSVYIQKWDCLKRNKVIVSRWKNN